MSNYKRGAKTEYKAIEDMEKVGYTCARMAGSHGIFDIICWNSIGVRFIQLKRCKERLGSYKTDLEQIRECELPPNSTGELWIWKDHKGWVKQEVVK